MIRIYDQIRLLCAIGILLGAGLAGAQVRQRGLPQDGWNAVPPLLRRAIRTGGPVTFAGQRIIEFRRGAVLHKHREFIVKDGDKFRIDFPNDSEFAGQVIVETRDRREHYFPDRNEILVTPPRRDEAMQMLRNMLARVAAHSHVIKAEAPASVAGIRTMPFVLSDRNGNALIRVWIDPESAMVLRREFYDHSGSVVGSLAYVEIDYRPNVRGDEFRILRREAKRITPEDQCRRLMREAGMAQVFLPPESGMRLEHARLMGVADKRVLLQVYQGPKGPVSLYQFHGDLNPERLRREAGAEFATLHWKEQGRTFVLVGQLTQEELQALRRQAQGGGNNPGAATLY